jgi:hypothetical protein
MHRAVDELASLSLSLTDIEVDIFIGEKGKKREERERAYVRRPKRYLKLKASHGLQETFLCAQKTNIFSWNFFLGFLCKAFVMYDSLKR